LYFLHHRPGFEKIKRFVLIPTPFHYIPDGNSYVQDINCVSAGPKFINPTDTGAWLPGPPFGPAPGPEYVEVFFGQKSRQTQIVQELNNIGFYIYTIDGPQVTVDYFSDDTGGFKTWPDGQTPAFNFVKKELLATA